MRLVLSSLTLAISLGVVFPAQEWWRTATFYQLYPRSFMDLTNDGIGDLKGMTSKVDYLVDLGIDAVWINPIYPSPMLDMGYDVSDYKDIDYRFGNMTDFQEFIDALHAKGIKLVLDFVPNHSSDQHPWFNKSVNSVGNYTNYYVWKDAKIVNNTRTVPNNWKAVFQGSMWEWNEIRQQYYLHQFLVKQPDLNFRDDNVRREMKEILQFWLDKGADGFRLDAVKYLVEEEQFLDQPINNSTDPMASNIYTQNQNLSYVIIKEWGDLILAQKAKDGKERVLLSEVYDQTAMVLTYTGESTQPFSYAFNIDLIYVFNSETISTSTLISTVETWMKSMPSYSVANWQVGNHDRNRVASRAGTELTDSVNMLMAMLPGVMFTYYGEELGMTDIYVSTEQRQSDRDYGRGPFQWNDNANAGFCTNATPWLPINPNYWWLNAAAQNSAERSHLKIYKNLVKIRKSETFLSNATQYKILSPDNVTVGLLRWAEVGDKYLLIINFGDVLSKPLTSTFLTLFDLQNVTTFIVNTTSMNAGNYKDGQIITVSDGISLRPKAGIILQVSSGKLTSGVQSSVVISLTVLCISLFTYVFS